MATINISASLVFLFFAGHAARVEAAVDDLNCESSGMAGFEFGQVFQQENAELLETSYSEIRHYLAVPVTAISPFERVIISVTPTSRKVFSISLELAGQAANLDNLIAERKILLSTAHPNLQWQVVESHHYGENTAGLELTMYRIGDFGDGQPMHMLNYDCVSKAHRQKAIEEVRELTGQ